MDVLEVLLACQTGFARRHAAAAVGGGDSLPRQGPGTLPGWSCFLFYLLEKGGSWISVPPQTNIILIYGPDGIALAAVLHDPRSKNIFIDGGSCTIAAVCCCCTSSFKYVLV